MLGAIESLMSAVVSDKMSHDKHNPNVELVAQGVANILSPLVGGLPATGAIARTATNVRAGAKTPVAGMIHALTLLAIILFAAPLVKNVPLAALAAILMMVAYNMGDWEEIPEILKLSAADIAIWLVTLTLTVVTDLSFAVEFGMILAALTFIRKVSRPTTVTRVTRDCARFAGQRYSRLRGGVPRAGAVPFWRDGQVCGHFGRARYAAADRDFTFAEYDRD